MLALTINFIGHATQTATLYYLADLQLGYQTQDSSFVEDVISFYTISNENISQHDNGIGNSILIVENTNNLE